MKTQKRYKVQCLSCDAVFNNDYKSTHEAKIHHGKHVRIKLFGAPENPFVAANAKRKQNPISKETNDNEVNTLHFYFTFSIVVHN